jgi:hypothetical protein
MASILDQAVLLLVLCSLAVVLLAVLLPSLGAGPTTAFSYHPVLMSTAFVGLLPLGIIAYVSDAGPVSAALGQLRYGMAGPRLPFCDLSRDACPPCKARGCPTSSHRFLAASNDASRGLHVSPPCFLAGPQVLLQLSRRFPDRASRRVVHGSLQLLATFLCLCGWLLMVDIQGPAPEGSTAGRVSGRLVENNGPAVRGRHLCRTLCPRHRCTPGRATRRWARCWCSRSWGC